MNSALELMKQVALIESDINLEQQKLIDATEEYFVKIKKDPGKWS